MGGRHLFLSKFEPHEYIIYSKKTNKKLKRGWFERGEKLILLREAAGTPQRQTLWPVITLSEKKKTTLVFASCDSKITSLLCDQLH